MTTFENVAVAEKFAAYPEAVCERLLTLRQMVLEVAAATPGVGRLEETLKWGQPSYLTPQSKSGTTIRIDAHAGGGVALFVNCQTNLVESWREQYPELDYEGVRALVLREGPLPDAALRHCIGMALTYHARKKG